MPTDSVKGMGKGMLVAAWVIVLALMTWFFSGVEERQYNPNASPQSHNDGSGRPVVTLTRNRMGHYVANGYINAQEVTFLLDTGATGVAMSESTAKRLGLNKGHTINLHTANGIAKGYRTQLKQVRLGDIVLNNISGLISAGMEEHDEILLGMSFLKHLEFTQRGNQLILKQL